jgi:glyoxylase-like metal-dependent hydrolase (beta-lactamase superfamily II)
VRVDTFSRLYESNTFWLNAEQKAVVDLGSLTIAKQLPLDEACCVILTHSHYDHTAALDQLELPSSTIVMMHEADATAVGTSASAAHFFGAPPPQFNVDTLLRDGASIDLGDSILRVIHTPGHTPGSICLYEAHSKSLFSGDTVFPHGGIGRTDLPGGNSHDLTRSISRLTKLEVSVLYPGHGEVTASNVNEQIKRSLTFAKANESPE